MMIHITVNIQSACLKSPPHPRFPLLFVKQKGIKLEHETKVKQNHFLNNNFKILNGKGGRVTPYFKYILKLIQKLRFF